MKSVFILLFFVGLSAHATVEVYTNPTQAKLTVEQNGKKAFVKLEGVPSKWAGKVISTEVTGGAGKDRFSFDYTFEAGGEKITKTYTIVAQINDKYENHKSLKQMEIYFPEGDANKPVKVALDVETTKKSQGLNLAKEAKAHPFKPEVD
jgi:hypothetical protein